MKAAGEEKETQLTKDKECLHCKWFWECKGKEKGTLCVLYNGQEDEQK